MATYKLTPDTGETSGTQSNMPLLVKPSLLEMGSLTSAEADSVRFYSDASLTTELAREVENSDEIWVKVPSVSSSTEIWMTYDGVSSDYGVTDTYGRNNVWTNGYLHVYHMGETSGSTCTDSVGNNNGTYGGALPTQVSAHLGSAQDFASGDYITLPTGTLSANGEWTLSCWANTDGNTSSRRNLFREWTTPRNKFIFRVESTEVVNLFAQDTSNNQGNASYTSISNSTDYLYHGVYDSSFDLRLYIDGSEVANDTTTMSSGSETSATEPTAIGAQPTSTDTWVGTMDEARLQTSGRSADWIATEYNNQSDNAAFWVGTEVVTSDVKNSSLATNLVSYWELEEASGTRVDSHGSNDLTDNNTVGQGTGIQGNCADLVDGSTEYLSFASSSTFVYDGASARSLSFWFYPHSVTGVNTVVSCWSTGTGQNWLIYTNGSNIVAGVEQSGALITATSAATINTWHHVVLLLKADGSAELFVDNVSKGTGTSGSSAGANAAFYIGQNGNTNYYDGLVDEVGWWTKELSTGEISSLYNSGSGIPYDAGGAATFIPKVTMF